MVCQDISEYFLFPSTLFAARGPHRVQTILGSCIGVCLFDCRMKFGGINHYMMPWWNGRDLPSPKYGDVAIDRLIEKMVALGGSERDMVAKIFGGANQLTFRKGFDIGEQNVSLARDLLKKHEIKIVGENVGGDRGRKIVFHTDTGQVFMKFLERTDASKDHEAN